MNHDPGTLVNTMLLLLVTLLQFLTRHVRQISRVKALEARLTKVEAQVANLQKRSDSSAGAHQHRSADEEQAMTILSVQGKSWPK